MDALGSLRPQRDSLALQHRLQRDRGLFGLAPAHGDPRVGRHEGVRRSEIDDRKLVRRPHLGFHLVSHDDAAKARAKNNDLRHDNLPFACSFFAPTLRANRRQS